MRHDSRLSSVICLISLSSKIKIVWKQNIGLQSPNYECFHLGIIKRENTKVKDNIPTTQHGLFKHANK